jgi:hypothetical protein
LTEKGEKRLVVERLYQKGKRAAFRRSGANRGAFSMAAEIERDPISQRTKEALFSSPLVMCMGQQFRRLLLVIRRHL